MSHFLPNLANILELEGKTLTQVFEIAAAGDGAVAAAGLRTLHRCGESHQSEKRPTCICHHRPGTNSTNKIDLYLHLTIRDYVEKTMREKTMDDAIKAYVEIVEIVEKLKKYRGVKLF
jgi:hypothetical protein